MTESATGEREVVVSTFVAARPSTVFAILTDPERFGEWMQGVADFAPEVGSDFRIDFAQFETVVVGTIREVVRDQRLVLTWGVAKGRQMEWFPPASSTVEIDLTPEEDGTRVTLRHSDLPEKEVAPHHSGWRFHIGRLDLKANRTELTDLLPRRLADWSAAWAEADADRRMELLEECCDAEVNYSDEYATLTGRDDLSTHIGNTIRYLPWTRLSVGAPSICRSEAVASWSVEGDDGQIVHRGLFYFEVDSDGRLIRVSSFPSQDGSPP